jgi:hypothetical protein
VWTQTSWRDPDVNVGDADPAANDFDAISTAPPRFLAPSLRGTDFVLVEGSERSGPSTLIDAISSETRHRSEPGWNARR